MQALIQPKQLVIADSPKLQLRHAPAWVDPATATLWLEQLQQDVPWKQESIQLYGKRHPLPRLTCWMADPGCGYRYSGLDNVVEPWSPTAQRIREQLVELSGWHFNSLLLNLYRDGRDAMGFHADDEPELNPEAPIASLSLGDQPHLSLQAQEGTSRPRFRSRAGPWRPVADGSTHAAALAAWLAETLAGEPVPTESHLSGGAASMMEL